MPRVFTRFRVWAGLILALAATVKARPCLPDLAYGSGLLLLGAAWRLWAAGHVQKNTTLTLSGPYGWHRHPLYFGTFLAGLGVGFSARQPWYWPVFLIFFIAVYGWTVKQEERDLHRRFGAAFQDYRERVPAVWPLGGFNRFRPRPLEPASWSWSLVRKNRELPTTGILVAWAMVFWIVWMLRGAGTCPGK